jgi:hypothetical protein
VDREILELGLVCRPLLDDLGRVFGESLIEQDGDPADRGVAVEVDHHPQDLDRGAQEAAPKKLKG